MYALGMPNAILWGVLAARVQFRALSRAHRGVLHHLDRGARHLRQPGQALAVPGVFLCLHLIEGQLVQPLTVGRRFEVNALVVLLAVWFGYGFWGIPGMLLATPVLVALKVAAQHQPIWRTVRDFLAPNDYWHPKSLKRLRIAKDPGAGRAAPESEPSPARRSRLTTAASRCARRSAFACPGAMLGRSPVCAFELTLARRHLLAERVQIHVATCAPRQTCRPAALLP